MSSGYVILSPRDRYAENNQGQHHNWVWAHSGFLGSPAQSPRVLLITSFQVRPEGQGRTPLVKMLYQPLPQPQPQGAMTSGYIQPPVQRVWKTWKFLPVRLLANDTGTGFIAADQDRLWGTTYPLELHCNIRLKLLSVGFCMNQQL